MANKPLPDSTNDEDLHMPSVGSKSSTLDVYARPFVPWNVKAANEVPVNLIESRNVRWIDFESYLSSFAGSDFLQPEPIQPRSSRVPNGRSRSEQAPTQLDFENYAHYFTSLLNIEEAALLKLCQDHALYKVPLVSGAQMRDTRPSMYLLHVPGMRESSLRIEMGDTVLLRQLRLDPRGFVITPPTLTDPQGRPVALDRPLDAQHNAAVWGVDRTRELLSLRVDYLVSRSMLFNVQFTIQSRRLDALVSAVKQIQDDLSVKSRSWIHSMLFPEEKDGQLQRELNALKFVLELYDTHLNFEQKKAIDSGLGENYGTMPFLISGPPGTGKTKTLVELAMQMITKYRSAHLLMCAPSDPAADTLIHRLSKYLGPKQLFRLNSPSRTFVEVPNTVLPYCCVDKDIFSLPSFAQLMQLRIVVTTCRDSEVLARAKMTNRDLYSLEQNLHNAIHPGGPGRTPMLHWSCLLIDEAAQATEPEAVMALNVVAPPIESQNQQHLLPTVVMAGDQHQLGPRTASRMRELQTSLFERLLSRPVYRDHPLARSKQTRGIVIPLTTEMLPIMRPAFINLIRNYRSHPAIIAVPSVLFYNDTLQPEADDTDLLLSWTGWRGRGWPVLFSSNTTPDDIEQDGGGWYNYGEARRACEYAQSFVQEGLLKKEEICIMSPFSAQVKVLRQMARQASFGLRDVNIGPVEAFQGLESRLVILCTTRTRNRFLDQDVANGFGIIHEPRRFTVALTRAMQGLIVIGHPGVLALDDHWAAFIEFCTRNELVADSGRELLNDVDDKVDGDDHDSEVGPKRNPVSRLERQLLLRESLDQEEDGVEGHGTK